MTDEHLRRAAEAVLKIRDPDRMWSGWARAREQLMAELAAAEPHFRALHAEVAARIADRCQHELMALQGFAEPEKYGSAAGVRIRREMGAEAPQEPQEPVTVTRFLDGTVEPDDPASSPSEPAAASNRHSDPDGDTVERVATKLLIYCRHLPPKEVLAGHEGDLWRIRAREVIALVRGAAGSRKVSPRGTLTDEQYEAFFGCCPDAEPDDAPEPTPSAEEIWERVKADTPYLGDALIDQEGAAITGLVMQQYRHVLAELEKAR